MTDNKDVGNTETGATSISDHSINELVNIADAHLNPVTSTSSTVSSTTSSTRTHSPPLMGTSARAAKRRIDSDLGATRIEGTDTYNQQLQHHYQNLRQIVEDHQNQSPTTHEEVSPESRHSFSAKRDYFEQRFKTPPPTYDAPPSRQQQQPQKIITTITTTTTTTPVTSSLHDRTSSSSNESPSVDRVLEQAVELQKLSSNKANRNDSSSPLVIERTEEYQVFLDAVNHEVRRTPSISRTSIVMATKTGHATDLDQAQAQAQAEVQHLTDDHEAIQQLTRALQEHNVTTINEYKRLPSQTNPSTPSTVPPAILLDRTNVPVISHEFSVIDALLTNPLGTIDDRYNSLLSIRYNDIVTNLRNPEYLDSIKPPLKTTKESKQKKPKEKLSKEKISKEKISKEKKPKEKKSKKTTSSTTDTIEHTPVVTPHVKTSELLQTQKIEQQPITKTTVSSEETPLIDPKEKKKQDKENKKQIKIKSKPKSKTGDYEVLDAIIGSPISIRLPDSYLAKYHVSAPLSQSSLSPPVSPSIPPLTTTTTTTSTSTSKNNNTLTSDKNPTMSHLTKIVHELQLHHSSALVASLNTTPTKANTTSTKETRESVIAGKGTVPVVNEVVHQQPLLQQQQPLLQQQQQQQPLLQQQHQQQKRPVIHYTQTETRPQSEVIKPRIVYRYMDEYGRVLKISSTPPSQLREQPSQQQYSYRNTEPPHFHGRYIAVDDERRHPLPQYEQRATWQGEPKLPTTVTREDFELRDKRVPQLSEQSVPTTRAIPVSVDHEHSSKSSSSQLPRMYHYPNQQNVKLAWLPLSYQAEQPYGPSGTVGYDTDSTISERSATYRPYEYGPVDSHHHHHSRRPVHNDYYYNPSSGPSFYPPPPPVPYGGRGISPEYGGVPRNYIEVFRGGDFRETKPSEIYSLPLNEHIRTSPISPSNNRHSRYDQYQSERYGSMSNRNNVPSAQNNYYADSSPPSQYQQNIPTSTVHTSTYYTHRSPHQHRTVQSSPKPDYPNYVRQSKSFDYRPLRTKLQREYKITPNLLVDEWDYPVTGEKLKYSAATSTTNRSGVSSPDDVFINFRWHVEPPSGFDKNRYKRANKSSLSDKHQSQKSNDPTQGNDHDLGESKPSSQIDDSQPIYTALALHSFHAQSNRELSFKKGETILVKRRINDDWLEGEHQGLTGIFPLNYVELFPYETMEQNLHNETEAQMEGEAIVKYDFMPQKTFELQLRKDEKVILLRKLDHNWYEGRVNDMEGIFPGDYVDVVTEPKDDTLKQSNQVEHTTNVPKMPKSVLKQTTVGKINPVTDFSLPLQKCQVLYDYIPQNVDELEIHVGDVINILEKCDDGWYCGIMDQSDRGNSMKFGTFPGNYVKILPI